ncbi:MAG TPA: S8 family serine peptidase [Frankiaceae bacterium]|nr:S8 family serine peptidase [Frankiaceae bacterium]
MAALRKHVPAAVAAGLTVAALAGAVPAAAGADADAEVSRVVVATTDEQAAERVNRALRTHGAARVQPLKVVNGFAADVPASYVPSLRRLPGVRSVTVDSRLRLMSTEPGLDVGNPGSLAAISRIVNADRAWEAGVTGQGVDVALIDSGISPVQGLTSGNVVNGPDLSFESQSPALTRLDTFGHGTHMASIIAGRDAVASGAAYAADTASYKGIAPDSRIVSVKVADHSGATDVSQVIAGIDWVVQHRRDNGLNIRVMNLSFGTDSTQWYRIDPLSFAVENAWRKGIAVVVAGGNNGRDTGSLANPAQDPYVIAVGASDSNGTKNVLDDTVPAFSSRGSSTRYVDVVAPGVSVHGLRNPGSAIDQQFPSARSGERFFKGTGTSQAAAVVSGSAALLLSRYPSLTPDQVKKHLMDTATPFDGAGVRGRGQGVVNVRRAVATAPPSQYASAQTWGAGTGTGSLEASRGSYHVGDSTSQLTGEIDIFGNAFDSAAWAAATSSGNAWSGGTWNGAAWSGNAWSSDDWTGNAWSGAAWSGNAWSGNAWSDESWAGHAWSGASWTGAAWSGSAWSGAAWSGAAWSGASWTGASWLGSAWSSSSWE